VDRVRGRSALGGWREHRHGHRALPRRDDSVANSIGDILAYVVGYRLATVLPVSASVAVFVLVDSALALWIRDGLLLNVVMLVHPIEAVRLWQMRGHGG
jgi:hypothetical protein